MPGPRVTVTKSGFLRGRPSTQTTSPLVASSLVSITPASGSARIASLTIPARCWVCDATAVIGRTPRNCRLSDVIFLSKRRRAAPRPAPWSFSSNVTHVSSHEDSMASVRRGREDSGRRCDPEKRRVYHDRFSVGGLRRANTGARERGRVAPNHATLINPMI